MKKGMEKALKVVLGYLKDIAMPISQHNEIRNVCMVSSNHTERIADIVAQTLTTVGVDGVMNIVESPTGESAFKLVNGLIFPRGFVSNLFVQEASGGNTVEQCLELDQPLVLVVTDKIKDVSQILPVLELVKKANKPLVLFSEDLREEPLSTMVYNCTKGIVNCVAVNMPWTGGVEKENLNDVAIITGATIIDNGYGIKLEDVEMKHFGRAKFIKVNEFETSIVDGAGDKDAFEEHVISIKKQIDEEEKQQLKGVHRERLARLTQKIAEIWVGGSSQVEKGEERDLIVDAINSAKSAVQHGVLPGGGIALYHASKLLEDGLPDLLSDSSERIGAQILGQAMKTPIN